MHVNQGLAWPALDDPTTAATPTLALQSLSRVSATVPTNPCAPPAAIFPDPTVGPLTGSVAGGMLDGRKGQDASRKPGQRRVIAHSFMAGRAMPLQASITTSPLGLMGKLPLITWPICARQYCSSLVAVVSTTYILRRYVPG